MFNRMVVYLPASQSLSYFWNLGSFLGMALVFQSLSGLLLLLNYSSQAPYDAVMFIMIEVNYGWFIKLFHSNNASLVFALLYLHFFKNMMMSSFRLHMTWNSGVTMMLFIMGAGFSGYALVGSQMSYWAVAVITSLISVVPINGEKLLYFVWGGYSISWVTMEMLLLVHFILPFLVLGLMVLHLIFLHNTGSTSVLGVHSGVEKVPFYPYYWVKDSLNLVVYGGIVVFMLLFPYSLGEPELFEEANTLNSPVHIVPEWYYLVVYAILRSVPNKALGVLLVLLVFVIYYGMCWVNGGYMTPVSGSFGGFVLHVSFWVVLSYVGMSPIESPFTAVGLVMVFMYLFYLLFFGLVGVMSSLVFSSA